MRHYKCLHTSVFEIANYKLVPIRHEDKDLIMQWRNEQIDILRQNEMLTQAHQDNYFNTVVANLFEVEQPKQLLFSFLENDVFIGYGGLVHIDWQNQTAEISFLTQTQRNESKETFINDWCMYLELIKRVANIHLNFKSIFTYAYDIRPHLYIALEKSGFVETKRIENGIDIHNSLKDIVIHAIYFNALKQRNAVKEDVDLYYKWVNDPLVRENSFNQKAIGYEEHVNWFKTKISSDNCWMTVFLNDQNEAVGQVRIDKGDETIIDVSIDKKYRGISLASKLIALASASFFKQQSQTEIIAYIKKTNTASYNSFLKAGFKETGNADVFKLKLTSNNHA
jgi:RimJ/RimL family protein N-acetyltransferase